MCLYIVRCLGSLKTTLLRAKSRLTFNFIYKKSIYFLTVVVNCISKIRQIVYCHFKINFYVFPEVVQLIAFVNICGARVLYSREIRLAYWFLQSATFRIDNFPLNPHQLRHWKISSHTFLSRILEKWLITKNWFHFQRMRFHATSPFISKKILALIQKEEYWMGL